MEPIISPVWIYLIHVANMVYGLSIIAWGVSLLILVLISIDAFDFDGSDSEESKRKYMKKCAIVMVVCTIVFILIPDKNTMYAMFAASIVTPDNISVGEEHIVNLIAKIANAIHNAPK